MRVGQQRAALLGAWKVDLASGLPATRFDVLAQVVFADAFWLTQGPFELQLRFGRFLWIWSGVTADVASERAQMLVVGKPTIVKDGELHEQHG